MKTLKLTLLVMVTTCLTFSCKSDDDGGSSGNLADLILGTWKWTAASENGVEDTLTECDLMDTVTFTSTAYSGIEHDPGTAPCTEYDFNGTYSISGNTIIWDGDSEDTDEIETLNSTTLVLKYVGENNTVYRDTYTKQ